MKHFMLVTAALAVIALSAPALHSAQGTPDPNASAKQTRRMAMVTAVRAINVAEIDYLTATGQFADLKTLAESEGFHKMGVNVPLNTDLRVFGDPAGKTFFVALKDTLDPCLYTVFSNESGIIFIGQVAQGCTE